MFRAIALFELRYHLRAPLFYVGFVIFFLLSFGSVVIDEIRIGGRGNVNYNSPYAILQTLAIMNVFGIFIVTAFVASAVIRDDETGFASILRSTRIRKLEYLAGRFTGALVVAFLAMASVPLGMLVGSWMPWVDAEKLGPFVASHYVYALFVYALPTLMVIGAGFFALATATRSMMWTYVGAVAFLALFFISRVLFRDPALDTLSALVDPFGIGALAQVTKYWTAAERNTQLPSLAGLILYNRLLWTAIGLALLAAAYSIFRFEVRGRKISGTEARGTAAIAAANLEASHHAARGDGSVRATGWQQLLALTRFDMRAVFKSPAFFVLLAIGIVNSYGAMYQTVEFRGTEYFPVTRALVLALQGAFSIIPVIIAIYYSGELVWGDRERRIHEIVDSTAAPDWAFIVPKVLAITLVLVASLVIASLTGIAFQLMHGYLRIDPMAWLLWFVLPGAIAALMLAMLAIFVQVLSPHKFVGWAVMLLYIVASLTLNSVGLEHNLYHYAGTSDVPLSDMNGMGRFWIGRAWFQAYWLAFTLILGVLSYALWRRGIVQPLRLRLRLLPLRLRSRAGAVLAIAAAAWVLLGGWIYYNTNVLNDYTTQRAEETRQADYEKALLVYMPVPQPRIVDIRLNVDIHPDDVRVITDGSYVIENRTQSPLPAVHVRWARPLKMRTLDVEGAAVEKEYTRFDYRIYRFSAPMQPGEKRTIRFRSVLEQRGFPNARPLTRIVGNGTFVNNIEIAPIIGMSRDLLLQDRAKRRKHGLPPELRPPKLEDMDANANHYLRRDSDFVTGEITLTTDAGQVPVAPGTLVSDTVKGSRRTIVTRTEAPIHNFFSMQSARYSVAKDRWMPAAGNATARGVELAVYHDPSHSHNVARMLNAMKVSLDLFDAAFSPYQFNDARIVEFPAYASFAQAFAATIPYSESIGFVQNHRDSRNDEKIDFVTYVTAHEIAHQWWAHQVIGAEKQGMTMLSESFAQYSALLVMEKLYGAEQIRKFLKSELDSYLRNRGGEVIEELPLVRVENQQYIHYQKGSLVMYWLKEAVGADTVNRALQRLLQQFAFKPAPYPSSTDFIRLLREEAGPQHDQLITDLFEKITLYDMKASNAKATKLRDERYEVTFDVDGKKLYADGKGKETEAPLDEPFDVGAFTDEPGKKGYRRESVIFVERRAVRSGRQSITLTVDKLPKFVGVDPFNKRIDRNSDDNLTRVDTQ